MLSKITDHLFLAEYGDVIGPNPEETKLRFTQLKSLGITNVLSLVSDDVECCLVAKEAAAFRVNRKYGVHLSHQSVPDISGSYEVGFKLALKQINNIFFNDRNAKILIHCSASIDRAPFTIAAYMVRTGHIDLADAYKEIRAVRSSVVEHWEWAWWINSPGCLKQQTEKAS